MLKNDLDDVKTKVNIGMIKQAKPSQCTPRNQSLLLPIHRLRRGPVFKTPAGFHLRKNERRGRFLSAN